jgi:hypothetical protein
MERATAAPRLLAPTEGCHRESETTTPAPLILIRAEPVAETMSSFPMVTITELQRNSAEPNGQTRKEK